LFLLQAAQQKTKHASAIDATSAKGFKITDVCVVNNFTNLLL
jgi:hypothetical protein